MERNMYKKMILGIFLLVATGIFVNSSQLHAADQEKDLVLLEKLEQNEKRLCAVLNLNFGILEREIVEELNSLVRSMGPDIRKGSASQKSRYQTLNELQSNHKKYEKELSKIVVAWNDITRIFLSEIYSSRDENPRSRVQSGNSIKEIKEFFIAKGNEDKPESPYNEDYMKVIVNGKEECDDEYKLRKGDLVAIEYEKTIGRMASSICGKIRSAVPMPSLPWKK